MSSLVCNVTTALCIFTRVDTDGPAVYYPEYSMYPTIAPRDPVPDMNTTDDVTMPEEPPRLRKLQEEGDYEPYEEYEDEEEQEHYDYYPRPPYDDYMYNPPPPPEDTTIAPWTDPENQDMLSETVAITRDYRRGIFNAFGDPFNQWDGPMGTEWAYLPDGEDFLDARCSMQFRSWREIGQPRESVGRQAVVHLTEEDVYYHIKFLSWTPGREEGRGVENPLGGGFSYERDMDPFSIPEGLPECPVCSSAMADKPVLTPRDGSFEEVSITGVTPSHAAIEIIAISQESNPACNSHRGPYQGTVEPNAGGIGTSTALLRKTGQRGSLSPFRYTIYFRATTEAGYCRGQVQVCVPANGFTCDDYYWPYYDATSSDYCTSPY